MIDILAPDLDGMDLKAFMAEALREAEAAGQAGELPIGAVVVIDGEIVSRGGARHKALRSQVRHAELNAILDGGDRLWNDFRRAILFTTVEPCPLCLGAAVMADIPHIVFGLRDGVVQSSEIIAASSYIRRHIRTYLGGVLEEQSAALFARFDPASLEYIRRGGGGQVGGGALIGAHAACDLRGSDER
jgi:tRNA(adenine34) deaminase